MFRKCCTRANYGFYLNTKKLFWPKIPTKILTLTFKNGPAEWQNEKNVERVKLFVRTFPSSANPRFWSLTTAAVRPAADDPFPEV